MKKLLLFFLCSGTLLLGMSEETTDKSVETSEQQQRKVPSLRKLCFEALLRQDPQTAGHRLHGHSNLLSDLLLQRFGSCRPEWGIKKLLAHTKRAEALGVKSEVEKAAAFLAPYFDSPSDIERDVPSVAAKVRLFNALDNSPTAVRNAISAQRTTMPLQKKQRR